MDHLDDILSKLDEIKQLFGDHIIDNR
jgi:hypothetical protein